jgi:hypothetical protein
MFRLAPTVVAAAALVILAISRDLAPDDVPLPGASTRPLAVAVDPPARSRPPSGVDQAPALSFSVYRAGIAPRAGSSGDLLRAGDVLELHLQPGRFRAAHVFAVDGAGQARPLFDWSPSGGGPPPTWTLDDSPGPQQVVVLFHELPDPAAQLQRLREAIARTYAGASEVVAAAPWHPADGQRIVTGSILIRKEPAR